MKKALSLLLVIFETIGTNIESSNLVDYEVAATYLTSTYAHCVWNREE